MASPSLKDCPKVAMDLKSQLESFSPKTLNHADTAEKLVLPTADGEFQVSTMNVCVDKADLKIFSF